MLGDITYIRAVSWLVVGRGACRGYRVGFWPSSALVGRAGGFVVISSIRPEGLGLYKCAHGIYPSTRRAHGGWAVGGLRGCCPVGFWPSSALVWRPAGRDTVVIFSTRLGRYWGSMQLT
jgi:hypothetical protein